VHSNINQVCTSYELVHTKGVAMPVNRRKLKFIKRVKANKRNSGFRTKTKEQEHYENIINDALKWLYGDKND